MVSEVLEADHLPGSSSSVQDRFRFAISFREPRFATVPVRPVPVRIQFWFAPVRGHCSSLAVPVPAVRSQCPVPAVRFRTGSVWAVPVPFATFLPLGQGRPYVLIFRAFDPYVFDILY